MTISVINNPTTHPASSTATPTLRPIEAGDAISLLTDRQMHVTRANMTEEVSLMHRTASGAFLAGGVTRATLQAIRMANPTVPLIVEPDSMNTYAATATNPFQLPQDPRTGTVMTLAAALDAQRAFGSDLAMTPTGQIAAGDAATLKAALKMINSIDRTDTLFVIAASANWLSVETSLKLLIKVINYSNHPVALAFIDPTNPVASMKRMRAYRRVFEEAEVDVVAYRADMVGFDALAHGAIASAIGSYPSIRRLTPIGKSGGSSDPEDRSPHMFIADMLRFVRSKHLRNHWFNAVPPLTCSCAACNGADIDRLYGSDAERHEGHNHNVLELDRLYATHQSLDLAGRNALWKTQAHGAMDTYPQLETYIGRKEKIPNDLGVFAS